MSVSVIVAVGTLACSTVVDAQITDTTETRGIEEAILAIESTEEAEALQGAVDESGSSSMASSLSPARRTHFDLTYQMTRRINTGRGYNREDTSRSTYQGSPIRALLNIEWLIARRLTVRFGAEKDAGERFRIRLRDKSATIDFLTATVDLTDMGVVESLVVGDFVAHWGWGLLLGRPSFGISSRPSRPRSSGIRPYRGFNESSFYRGVAVSLRMRNRWSAAVFASRRAVDAMRDTSSASQPVPSYRLTTSTGLHRTATEISRRGRLGIDVVAGYVKVKTGHVEGGFAAHTLRFGGRVIGGDRSDQMFAYEGQTQWGASVYLAIQAADIEATAELAMVDGRRSGLVVGGVLPVRTRGATWVYYRNLARSGYSLLGAIPRSGSGPISNESGVTFGIRYRPAQGILVRASHDRHWFGWLRFGVLTPTHGHRSSVSVETRLGVCSVKLRTSTRGRSVPTASPDSYTPPVLTTTQAQSWRYSMLVRIPVRRAGRIDVRYGSTIARRGTVDQSTGHIVAIDFRSSIAAWLEIEARFALFDSETGQARVYAYEPGMSYGASIPSFSGNGERWMTVARLRARKWLDVQLKYSLTRWPGRDVSGSGLDETPGDAIAAVEGELRIRF